MSKDKQSKYWNAEGLSTSQKLLLCYLEHLSDSEGLTHQTQTEISQVTGLNKRTITRAVDTLEKHKYVKRIRQKNGRNIYKMLL